jgi:hypothetical protein
VLIGVIDRLPPILVHARTMRVIDGMHRVLAARSLGRRSICARLFHGSEAEAEVQAVFSNVSHGKPLTLADRQTAARNVLTCYPTWSDRRVAAVCGLSPKTVGRVRQECGATEEGPQLRLGRDGKARPSDPALLRRRIAQALEEHPHATVQEIVARTGASPGTVRDVRKRVRRGDNILPSRIADAQSNHNEQHHSRTVGDTAVVSRRGGPEFTEWFESQLIDDDREWERFIEAVPLSRVYEVADTARSCAERWKRFADALEARSGGSYATHK